MLKQQMLKLKQQSFTT